MKYSAAIGLEVHVQLDTQSKMFCSCSTQYGADPNTQVCPICLGYPGAMPAMNVEAIRRTVMTGLMIGSDICACSTFDRKSYFYPDMPKNYQISQYDKPLCSGGVVEIEIDGVTKPIRVRRIHLEEDVGKNMHFRASSGVDFNRAGVPLMEIVTEPEMTTPEEALAFLVALKQMVTYARVSPCNLEEGNLRCDVNCSLRPAGRRELGVKTEIKNMNTFKGVQHALEYEMARQLDVLARGGTILQETRRWDPDTAATLPMRTKEKEHDYRYFPEPDLMPVALSAEEIDALKEALPERPDVRHGRLMAAYGLSPYDAGVLVGDRALADYFEAAASAGVRPKAVANWIMTEVMRYLTEQRIDIQAFPVRPEALASLVGLVEDKTVNGPTAKQVFAVLCDEGGDPADIVAARGWAQVSASGAIEGLVDQAMVDHPASVADYRGGKKNALQFLVGQVMRQSKGKANPKMVGDLLRKRMDAENG